MVVSGSLNRWDRWYFHHPIGSIYHLYTTYSPCQLGFLYATYQETPLTQFNNWGRLRATVPWIEITFLGSSHPCEGIICLTGNYRLWNGKWFGMIYIYTSNILYILNIHTYIYIYICTHLFFRRIEIRNTRYDLSSPAGKQEHLKFRHPARVQRGFQSSTFSLPSLCHTVDGRNPKQPPGMYKTLWIQGYLLHQLVQDFFHQQLFWSYQRPKHSVTSELDMIHPGSLTANALEQLPGHNRKPDRLPTTIFQGRTLELRGL